MIDSFDKKTGKMSGEAGPEDPEAAPVVTMLRRFFIPPPEMGFDALRYWIDIK